MEASCFDQQTPRWLKWVGNMSEWTEWMDSKPWFSAWMLMKVLHSFFTSLGVVIFARNPITGVFIFVGLAVGNFSVAAAAVLAGSASIVCNAVMRSPEKKISSGMLVFNSVLFACVSTGTIPDALNIALTISFWIYLLAAIITTNVLDVGLNTVLSEVKLPGLSIPFNSVAVILFFLLKNCEDVGSGFIINNPASGIQTPVDFSDHILWTKVWEGAVLAMGQVYGVHNMASSILMWTGFIFCSPLLTVLIFLGSVTGCFMGLLFSAAPYTHIYMGLWGYNGLLTAGGLGYFIVQTPLGIMATLGGAALATVLQAVLEPLLAEVLMPVWSIPFNIAVLMILSTALREESPIKLVDEPTFPELHLRLHAFKNKQNQEKAGTVPLDLPVIVVSGGDKPNALGSIPEDTPIADLSPDKRKNSDGSDSVNLDDIVFSSKLSQTRNSKVFLSPSVFSKFHEDCG